MFISRSYEFTPFFSCYANKSLLIRNALLFLPMELGLYQENK